jgi:hypothetical protein
MARPDPRPRASAPAPRSRRSVQAALWLGAIVLTPIVIAMLGGRFDPFRRTTASGQPLPEWVTPGEIRASTRDGMLVKVRVALDAADASNRMAVQRRMGQLSLVLETSIGAQGRDELKGPRGMARLADNMRLRANAYLTAEGLQPLASVAIQDLWYAEP